MNVGQEMKVEDGGTFVIVLELGSGQRRIIIERPKTAPINAGDRAGVDLSAAEVTMLKQMLDVPTGLRAETQPAVRPSIFKRIFG